MGEKPRKTHRENPFLLSARAQWELADVRMRICHQNNGGSNITKREINKLWGEFFPQLCTCLAWGAADSNKGRTIKFLRGGLGKCKKKFAHEKNEKKKYRAQINKFKKKPSKLFKVAVVKWSWLYRIP